MSILEADLKIGSIFWWNQFPYKQQGGAIKPRWLILLGKYKEDIFEKDTMYVFVTTTTQKDLIKINAKSAKIFTPPRFRQDCYIYFDDKLYTLSFEKEIQPHLNDIDPVDEITAEEMREIYFGYFSHRAERKFLMDKWRMSVGNSESMSKLVLPEFK